MDVLDLSSSFVKQLNLDDDRPESENVSATVENDGAIKNGHPLTVLDLPGWLIAAYERMSITRLFGWQTECVGIATRKSAKPNLVYTAPTAAGKTLVAELLIFEGILRRTPGKKALFVVPFISMAAEKENYFRTLLKGSSIKVGGLYGCSKHFANMRQVDLLVCTYEKANVVVDCVMAGHEGKSCYEVQKLLSVVVLDEIHMALNVDESRNATIRLLVAKLRRYGTICELSPTRLIAMSATIPEPVTVLSDWLDADLYRTKFRPVSLDEYVFFNNKLMKLPSLEVALEMEASGDSADNEIFGLVLPVVSMNQNVLIFCTTKAWCERLSQRIASKLPGGQDDCAQVLDTVMEQVTDSSLRRLLLHRVAYHHAGLAIEERTAVETAYRQGLCKVLVATSTLCSGVNLPAHRVIIRSLRLPGTRGMLDWLSYKQMTGRAGRTGQNIARGESIAICSNEEELRLVTNELCVMNPLKFKPAVSRNQQINRYVLEAIGNQESADDSVHEFVRDYIGISVGRDVFEASLEWLKKHKFIHVAGNKSSQTQLGRACISAHMSPEEGLELFQEMQKALQDGIILDSDIHLLYLVSSSGLISTADHWARFLDLYGSLSPCVKRVADRVGVHERSLVTRVTRGNTKSVDEHFDVRCSKLYSSMVLFSLLSEWTVNKVASHFKLSKGQVQTVQQQAAGRCFCVAFFAKALHWNSITALMNTLSERIEYGLDSSELSDLLKVSLVDRTRARLLYRNGIETVQDLAFHDVTKLGMLLRDQTPFGKLTFSVNSGFPIVLGCYEAASELVSRARELLGAESSTVSDVNSSGTVEADTSGQDLFEEMDSDVVSMHGLQMIHSLDGEIRSRKPDNDMIVIALHFNGEISRVGFATSPKKVGVSDSIDELISLGNCELVAYEFEENLLVTRSAANLVQLRLLNWFAGRKDFENICSLVHENPVASDMVMAAFVYRAYIDITTDMSSEAKDFFFSVEMPAYRIVVRMLNHGIRVDRNVFNVEKAKLEKIKSSCDSQEARRLQYIEQGVLFPLDDLVPDDADSAEWIVRAHMTPPPTRTGRYYFTDPPTQNIPRTFFSSSVEIDFRSAFIPQEIGKVFISVDFRHIELSVMAILSKDDNLMTLLLDFDSDPFTETVKRLGMGGRLDRQSCKALVYSTLYGAGRSCISGQLKCSADEATSFREKMFELFPGVKRFIENLQVVDTSLGGRRINTPKHCFNTVVQSGASDVVKKTMVTVDKATRVGGMLCLVHFIHDELIYEVDQRNAEEEAGRLRHLAEFSWSGVRLSVKIKIGATWSAVG